MQPVRVLYVHHTAQGAGASKSLRILIESLRGFVDPVVLSPPGAAMEAFNKSGIETVPFVETPLIMSSSGLPVRGFRILDLLRAVLHARYNSELKRAVRKFRPQIVHLNERGFLYAARTAKRCGVKVVMHARNVADRSWKLFHELSVNMINRYVDHVIAIDESVRYSIREVSKCSVVYNPYKGRSALNRPERTSDQTSVGFLSVLREYKGIWDLIEAAKLLRARQDIVFKVAGGNSRPASFHRSIKGRVAPLFGFAPDVRQQLQKVIEQEEIGKSVLLLGHVDDTDTFLAGTDINVFPSHLNGPSRSVIEAGVLGVPSIVAMRDRIEDVVQHGRNGLIVPERQPHALAEAISYLVDNPAIRRSLGESARQQFEGQFSADLAAERVLDVYQKMLC